MTQGNTTVIKILLYIINVISLLLALGLIVLGSIATHSTRICRLEDTLGVRECNTANHPYAAPVSVLVFGLVMFFVCFIGCSGAYQESVSQLITYGILCFIFAIVMLILAVVTDQIVVKAEDGEFSISTNWNDNQKRNVYVLSSYVGALVIAGILGIILGCKLRDARLG